MLKFDLYEKYPIQIIEEHRENTLVETTNFVLD